MWKPLWKATSEGELDVWQLLTHSISPQQGKLYPRNCPLGSGTFFTMKWYVPAPGTQILFKQLPSIMYKATDSWREAPSLLWKTRSKQQQQPVFLTNHLIAFFRVMGLRLEHASESLGGLVKIQFLSEWGARISFLTKSQVMLMLIYRTNFDNHMLGKNRNLEAKLGSSLVWFTSPLWARVSSFLKYKAVVRIKWNGVYESSLLTINMEYKY